MSRTNETRANALLAVPRKLLDDYLRQASEQLARRRMILGQQIRAAREAKHWKQKDLAARVHVEPQTISNWERNVRVPDWEKLELLARELGEPVTDPEVSETALHELGRVQESLDRIEKLLRDALARPRDDSAAA
jgi:transcriptional regulator with XRE-family HTH domain